MKISDYLNKYGSDKCIRHTYQFVYDGLFAGIDRNSQLDILESGVEYGPSLVAWKEYFPNARVTGVDIVDLRKPEFRTDDVEFIVEDIKKYVPDRQFDFIVEDGNHSNEDCLWAGTHLPRWLKVGGILVIEDVQEAFMTPFLLWGKLHGDFIVSAVDMRRLTDTHDNFVITIQRMR